MNTESSKGLKISAGWTGEMGHWRGWFSVCRGDELLVAGATKRTVESQEVARDAGWELGQHVFDVLSTAVDEDEFVRSQRELQRNYSL